MFIVKKHGIISINPMQFIFKSEKEILKIVSETIKKHYQKTNGEIKGLGKIIVYRFFCEGKVYVFDTDGNLLKIEKR
ncbi:hypothetical protein NitYY0826_C1781 [Nitratiruptor sp. YY08-26]|uniref:hypothetical protein n=1 Tax=unclassified Nitratiruptor TaxID=2624044 RepID=UPI0019155298|nr:MULTISPECIES: hypothetical protein [unclassified Nitratiruptor]BCD62895.1 hypothetical protein NitYY0813_C1779 [Nitratiruptor sp. YY08-13]BCD66831.1 hypothetical protein NitYY0826_C1781 [Nitratiruptor sp. YY08-26]